MTDVNVEADSINTSSNNNQNTRGVTIKVPSDYPSIQQAIDNASNGDSILVSSGTYYEHIVINKSITLTGESAKTTIIDGNEVEYKDIIYVNADSVKISKFNITNSNQLSGSGIRIKDSSKVEVSDCIITDNDRGIIIWSSSSNKIINNTIINNSPNIRITESSDSNIIDNNYISDSFEGIVIQISNFNFFTNNTILSRGFGMNFGSSSYSIIENNVISGSERGISLQSSSNVNMIKANSILNNKNGIEVQYSCVGNEVHFNDIYGNQDHGVFAASDSYTNATNNWWGDASGPNHFTLNNEGKGNSVSFNVGFKPWLLAPFETLVDYIQIRTQPDGKGSIANTFTISTDEILQLWIAAYNHSYGYFKTVPVVWSTNGTLDLPPSNASISINFDPFTANTSGNIIVKDETGHINSTGLITINPGLLHHILIKPFNSTLFLNGSQNFSADGYDKDNNKLTIYPSWSTTSNCTITQNGIFTANSICLGTYSVYANQSNISGIASVTILINNSADTDSDKILDWWEIEYNQDPFDFTDANNDIDNDGLSNYQEFLNGTDPTDGDTDSDNLGDNFEMIFSSTDPNEWDSNKNGIGDGLEFLQTYGYTGGMYSLPDDWIGMTIIWENYTLYVSTNSSVLNAKYDKEKMKLDVVISGVKGTKGACNISVPKSLINSTKNIAIWLDNNTLNFSITQNNTYFLIHVNYQHSTHKLIADFSYDWEKPDIEPIDGEPDKPDDKPIDGEPDKPDDKPIDGEPDKSEDKPSSLLSSITTLAIFFIVLLTLSIIIVVIRFRKEEGYDEIPIFPPEELENILEKEHTKGTITDVTYKDIKSLLEKYR